MKKKIREQVTALAQQLIEEEKTFKAASVKGLVSKLYEKLTVLEYLENQIEDPAGKSIAASLDSKSFREENWFTEPEPVPQPEHKEDLIEPLMEKIKDIVAQMPEESERIDELLDEMLPKNTETESQKAPKEHPQKYTNNDLEEFASAYQQMPEFERKTATLFPKSIEGKEASKTMTESRARSINDTLNKGLNIGLNDRLAFIKHLFEGQTEDYTRVLSQINTMENFEEAQNFIKTKVKPDYNHWLNKEEYSERFMNIIEKRFN
ncbi:MULTISPECIES: hypothetical protein [Aequorivita]|uniref:Uncharacterized protein n=1 Tax=Aequorivita iocasae TaxID=2803865 RepID=A0ABX7DUG0_9FLAO|nr:MULTISPECIES: hypothetical protein [Aequorivita]QQX77728.1 hypothetical protein JK629_05550 [Aequorivita iocasae]UCA57226.1 hypothetical protein LDL78_05575 [Aequorivita sp. F7]